MVVKNEVAPPFKVAGFDTLHNEGISKAGDVLDHGVTLGVVEKRGSFHTVGEQRIGQRRENARQTLKDNPALLQDLEQMVRVGRTRRQAWRPEVSRRRRMSSPNSLRGSVALTRAAGTQQAACAPPRPQLAKVGGDQGRSAFRD
jgi:hypothetical protein